MPLADEHLTKILLETHTIAMIGASIKPKRASHMVGNYLMAAGFLVVPVNPGHAGKMLFGQRVVASVSDIDEPVDLLNVFRRPSEVAKVVRPALDALPGLKSVWMQLGIENAEARTAAEAKGLSVVEDRCILVEHRRLLGRESA